VVLEKKHNVFTLFGHVLPLIGLILGIVLGIPVGIRILGALGGFLGALGGGLLGLVFGQFPGAIVRMIISFPLKRKSTEELRASLRNGKCSTVNLATLELKSRGVDVRPEFDLILELLASIHHDARCRGWAAMLTAFPELAEAAADYVPGERLAEGQANRFRSAWPS
jgi:hypothetical protein